MSSVKNLWDRVGCVRPQEPAPEYMPVVV
ncbi:hypothetical protein E2C01_056267 [Portunus trituberculatus]|uniref:Uncharacterized protein n=2 Tax=Portunus trituberculatus TaxID=210409 RepID=A0A5B7GXM5_PORTR|nr:hypothetical protein [Portunus trituberculatus]